MTYADQTVEHMRACKACIGAKIANVPTRCATGRELIQLTLQERHGMNNDERRLALAEARASAVHHARSAESYGSVGDIDIHIAKASMWAAVAQALKDGNPAHDGVMIAGQELIR